MVVYCTRFDRIGRGLDIIGASQRLELAKAFGATHVISLGRSVSRLCGWSVVKTHSVCLSNLYSPSNVGRGGQAYLPQACAAAYLWRVTEGTPSVYPSLVPV